MTPLLSDRFAEAAKWAAQIHNEQIRKTWEIPYVSHLFAVASLVLEDDGTEDEAIAALLHDAIEDDKATAEEIRERFGQNVLDIVLGCSDSTGGDKAPWRERKQDYIAHLHDLDTSESILRVSNADKLHNARCMLNDYRHFGDDLWEYFNPHARNADAQLWYYEELAAAFYARRLANKLADELRSVVAELAGEVMHDRITKDRYTYKTKTTRDGQPMALFRYPRAGRTPDYLGTDGEWHPDPQLLRYAQDDPCGADDISLAEARSIAAALGVPGAVP